MVRTFERLIIFLLDTGKAGDNGADQIKRPCLFACMDQTYKTAVTTSTFPNMHTFLRGPEFCLMFRKVNKHKQKFFHNALNKLISN